MESKISLFGSTGFIGNEFSLMYDVYQIKRDNDTPKSQTDVLYMISTTHNYNVFDNPFLDINTNLTKLIKVLSEFKKVCEGRTFNFISSWFVYGETECPAKEDSFCNPKGFYSITKRTAEQLIESYCRTFNINYRILRLCNVYGENATKISSKRNALQFMVNKIINNQNIELYNNGTDIRDFMHVQDVCKAIHLCLDKSPKNCIINIGSGIPQDFRSIMEYVKGKTNSNSNFISVEPPDFHKIAQVKDMYLDTTKLIQLGFEQKISINEGLDRIIGANCE